MALPTAQRRLWHCRLVNAGQATAGQVTAAQMTGGRSTLHYVVK